MADEVRSILTAYRLMTDILGQELETLMSAVYTMKGVGEVLEVYEDKLTITPKGVLGFLSKGLKGTKTIPFFAISGIQFKKAGLTSGYLQFTIPGGNESKAGLFSAASDENTFMFSGRNELAEEIKNYIEQRTREVRNPQDSSDRSSVADELQKLADLKVQGILSDEEFQSAKRRLIG
ncbi:Uncharacterized protein SCF082_LOCUS50372 [Durusdinium trenchii]|uniref:SHOCT domain-containing protein n=1 Tax=Durusdinium trenchii TaxID=1381693 RepID=A0ABP0S7H4_9DINO